MEGETEEGEERSKDLKQSLFMAVWNVIYDLLNTPSTHHRANDHGSAGEAHASAEEQTLPDSRQQSPPKKLREWCPILPVLFNVI